MKKLFLASSCVLSLTLAACTDTATQSPASTDSTRALTEAATATSRPTVQDAREFLEAAEAEAAAEGEQNNEG